MSDSPGPNGRPEGGDDVTPTLEPAADQPHAAQIAPGTEVRGTFRYQVGAPLAKGGFASVHLARCLDTGTGRDCPVPDTVAIKFFSGISDDPDPSRLLKRELSSLLSLRHDRIIEVFDWNLLPPMPFVALRHYPAGNIFGRRYENRLPDEAEVWQLLSDLLTALSIAHRASILHLDIKPQNVLVDETGRFVLTDFGISQVSLVSHGMMEVGLGSPGYQAPEQRFRDTDLVGVQTDLWGVGVTAYSFYTGVRLSKRPDLLLSPGDPGSHGLPPISTLRPCSAALEAIIMSLLMSDPNKRPGSAAEVLASVMRQMSERGIEPVKLQAGMEIPRTDPSLKQALSRVLDPIWSVILSDDSFPGTFVRFREGEHLCSQGDLSYHAFVLVLGSVTEWRGGREVGSHDRPGALMGEISALSGMPRSSTLTASSTVWTAIANAADMEQILSKHPALALRLLKSFAATISRSA